jgi:hypothetical protein
MEFTEEKQQEIIRKIDEAIKKRMVLGILIALCAKMTGLPWLEDLLTIFDGQIGGRINYWRTRFTSVPIVCTNCGNTFFLNAKILGIEIEDKQGVKDDKKMKIVLNNEFYLKLLSLRIYLKISPILFLKKEKMKLR